MAKKPKTSRFSGKVKDNAQKTKASGSMYGYLNLPRGLNVFSPDPDGTYKLDFMPYVVSSNRHPDGIPVGDLWYKRPFKAHRQIGADPESVVCLSSIGKKCPICEARAQMIKDGADKKETDALKPSPRNLYIVIPVGEKKLEEKPYIFDISAAMFQNQLAEELDSENIPEIFPDLEQGCTLKIRFTPKTFGTSKPFPECSRIDAIERKEAYDEAVMDDIPDLDSILRIMSYQDLEKKFLEIDDEDEDVDEKPSPASHRKPKNPEPEEEDDAPEPPKRAKKAAPPPEPEDDDTDEGAVCEGCKGTGKSSKGKTCFICDGTGESPRPGKTQAKSEKKTAGKTCAFGHTFGADCEKYDHCDDCDDWDACIEAKGK